MPELPEVERYRRFLERHALGRTVRRVVVTDPGILRNTTASALDRNLRGRTFDRPDRHGKWLIGWTDGPAVLLHFGMTGDLVHGRDPGGRHRHDRVIFELSDGEVRYRNMRKLGGLWLAHGPDDVASILGPLGPDALSVSRRQFHDLLRARRGQVKPALLGQRLVAGVGNLIADEVLWQARIHPARPLHTLDETARDRLYETMKAVLRSAVRSDDYVVRRRNWLVHVRGLPGAGCPRCGTPLERTQVGGRTTYLCPACQR